MGKPSIKACPMPFDVPFVRLLSPCNLKKKRKLNGFQANFLETNKKINIITIILPCFVENMVKT
jgi:hypothetical protein